ncbi:MAG: penicillin-binding protein [Chthonomonadales bacterium]|nr:penicillin-binding protein [Chthonomonadales bacterium]
MAKIDVARGHAIFPAPVRRGHRLRRVAAVAALVSLAVLAALGVAADLMLAAIATTLPSVEAIAAFDPARTTTVMSHDGVVLWTLRTDRRRVVPIESISPRLVQATLAVEDERFYSHDGWDSRAIARALWANLLSGDPAGQGASTITQQLVRNVPEFGVGRRKTLRRKVRELLTAIRVEQVLDKRRILELYLNQIYYGHGAYGAEMAARTYFGTSADRLTLSQAALLAGLARSPEGLSPYRRPDAARARRDQVLRRMLRNGRISHPELDEALAQPLRVASALRRLPPRRAPYFVDWVMRTLERRYGQDAIERGMRVVTTLDWRMQKAAEKALSGRLPRGATQGALVCLNPHTGNVRAMVGGTDYREDSFNAAVNGLRQPGSAFKGILYAAALDVGAVSLEGSVADRPPLDPASDGAWMVRNYGGGRSGAGVTVLDAIRRSVNTVAVRTIDRTGVDLVRVYARRMGITTPMAGFRSLALGASAVHPIDLAAAYGVFAANGQSYLPNGIARVEDSSGRVLEEDDPWARRRPDPLQPTTTMQMNEALREVVLHGTGQAAARVPEARGKTGTTNAHRDAWFAGYTPDLVAVVWLAHPERRPGARLRYLPMAGATGGNAAAPIWARFMRVAAPRQREVNRRRDLPEHRVARMQLASRAPAAVSQAPAGASAIVAAPAVSAPTRLASAGTAGPMRAAPSLPAPEGAVCAESGMRATPWCPVTLPRRGAEKSPVGPCPLHGAPRGEG